jgi:hypothetical protein
VLAPALPVRRCPLCGSPVPQRLSPDGRRRRGRPRVFCSARCRLGDRPPRTAADPGELAAFASGVRAAIAARGLPLRELAAALVAAYPALASSVTTLSAWQSGTSVPSRTRDGRDRVLALERCLGVPAGDLALLLPGGAVVSPPRPPTGGDPAARRARLAHVTGPQPVLPVRLGKHARIGPDGQVLSVRVDAEVRAARDGVDRFWYVDGDDPRRRPLVTDPTGCRPGRRVPEPGRTGPGLVATELRLDRPLARGERHRLSFLVRYGPGGPGGRGPFVFRHVVGRPLESLDLAVSFEPRALPAGILACRWRIRDGVETARRETTLAGCRSYERVVADPAPGWYGWCWVPAGVVTTAA